ncbi:MAG: TonB-dependent receptor domain-containing protein, partial [Candidatus Acidiferrales bacterium]
SEAAGYWVGVPFKDNTFSINHTYQFSPRVLNDFRFSYGKFLVSFEGANTEPISNLRANITRITMPPNRLSFGLPTNLPQGRLLYNFQWSDNLSVVRGRHTIKAGLEFRRNRTTAPFLPNVNGSFVFGTDAGFATNTPTSTNFTEGPFALQPFETDQFYYVQDDIRLRPNFTLNLGLRYEHTGQPANGMHEETLARETGPGAFWNPAVPLEGRIYPEAKADTNNWGPRIGFAYTPRFWKGLFGEDKTVIRGGYSVAYEAAFYNILLNMSTAAPRVFAFSLAPGIPVPAGGTGASVAGAIPTPLLTRDPREFAATQISSDFASPSIQTWTLGAQRELGGNVVFEARYVGTKSTGQYQSVNFNPRFNNLFAAHPELVPAGLTPCSGATAPATFFGPDNIDGNADDGANAANRIDCSHGVIRMRLNGATSIYHGLQSRLDFRNVWNQITGGLSYSFGKSIDNVSEIFNFTGQGAFVFAENPFDYREFERGRSNFDLRHYFAGHYIWDSPFHRDQQGALGKIAGGWQINGQVFLFSGRPWTAQAQNGFSAAGGSNLNCRDDVAFNGTFIGVNAVCRPLAGDPSAPPNTVGAFGTATRWWNNPGNLSGIPFGGSRNTVVGDATQLVNMGLFKNTRFGPEGRFNLQMRWTMVNAFNVRNFGVPASVFTESASFGLPERRNFIPGRINRLALRFTF